MLTMSYLNTKTGEFVVLSSDELFGIDDDDDLDSEDADKTSDDQPEWMKEEKRLREEVLNSQDYLQLPEKLTFTSGKSWKCFAPQFASHTLEMRCSA